MPSSFRTFGENPTRRLDKDRKGAIYVGKGSNIKKQDLSHNMARREFMGKVLTTLGTVGAYIGSRALFAELGAKTEGERAQVKVQAVGNEVIPPVNSPAETSKTSGKNLVDVAFEKSTDQEKNAINEEVGKYKTIYKDRSLESSVDRLIRDRIGKLGLQKEVADLVVGMAIVESDGDSGAVNKKSGAKGIFQITNLMAEAHKMNIANDDNDHRLDVGKSLEVLLSELQAGYERWQDWGFAIWEWHIGAPKIYEIINLWGRDWEGETLPDINVSARVPNADLVAQSRIDLYKHRLSKWNLNVYKIFHQYDKIKNMFKEDEWDKTDEYLLRTVAAAESYRDARIGAIYGEKQSFNKAA